MNRSLKIGTRGSKLALWQTEYVRASLKRVFPELECTVHCIKTLGDRQPDLNLLENQGKGVFCSELEQALQRGEIDLAVHSVKDLPGQLADGLVLASFLKREDPRETLVARDGLSLSDLPPGAVIGTSSIRRQVQLANIRPDLRFEPIRGNVETRIRKVLDGQYDATILALAGLRRLGLEHYITQVFELSEMVPAPGQGCIGVEIREDDGELAALLRQISDVETETVVRAERAFLKGMGGHCRLPYGAYGVLKEGELELTGMFGEREYLSMMTLKAMPAEAEILGARLAEALLEGKRDEPCYPVTYAC